MKKTTHAIGATGRAAIKGADGKMEGSLVLSSPPASAATVNLAGIVEAQREALARAEEALHSAARDEAIAALDDRKWTGVSQADKAAQYWLAENEPLRDPAEREYIAADVANRVQVPWYYGHYDRGYDFMNNLDVARAIEAWDADTASDLMAENEMLDQTEQFYIHQDTIVEELRAEHGLGYDEAWSLVQDLYSEHVDAYAVSKSDSNYLQTGKAYHSILGLPGEYGHSNISGGASWWADDVYMALQRSPKRDGVMRVGSAQDLDALLSVLDYPEDGAFGLNDINEGDQTVWVESARTKVALSDDAFAAAVKYAQGFRPQKNYLRPETD